MVGNEKNFGTGGKHAARNTVGHKAEFRATGRSLYEYVDVDKKFSERASLGRRFVYVLLLNAGDDVPAVPFFVGESDDLRQRFISHRHISWHVDRFNRPVRVVIAGTVPETLARLAMHNLATRLTRNGYELKNWPVDSSGYFGRRTMTQLLTYANIGRPALTKIAASWLAFWQAEEKHRRVKVIEHVDAGAVLTKPDVIRFFHQREYKTGWAARFAQQLATAYDPLAGDSVWTLPYLPTATSRRAQEQQFATNLRALNGDWYLTENIYTDGPMRLPLSDAVRQAIIARKQVISVTPGTRQQRSTRVTAAEILAQLAAAQQGLSLWEHAASADVAHYFDEQTQNASIPGDAVLAASLLPLISQVWQLRGQHRAHFTLTLKPEMRQTILHGRRVAKAAQGVSVPGVHVLQQVKKFPKRRDIVAYISAQPFDTEASRRLAVKLAHAYDATTHSSTSTIVMPRGGASATQRDALTQTGQLLSRLWFTNDDMQFGTPLRFFLRATTFDGSADLAAD